MIRWLRHGWRGVRLIGGALLCAWIGLAAFAWTPGPEAVRWMFAAVVAAAMFWCGFWRDACAPVLAARGAIVVALIVLALPTPRTDRAWTPDQARQPMVRALDRDHLRIANVRHCRYRSTTDFEVAWEQRRVDLTRLDEGWLALEPFAPGSPLAHAFLSFGFRNGAGGHDYLAVSVEIRKEVGEHYSPVAGLFRRFELSYVIGDERDLIGLRVVHRRDEVYLYPLQATPAQLRELFVDLVRRADDLRTRPEFYHTIASTCASNLVDHLDRRWPGVVPRWDLRVLLPGNADALALERGLIADPGPLAACRARWRVDAAVATALIADPRFSAAIRRR